MLTSIIRSFTGLFRAASVTVIILIFSLGFLSNASAHAEIVSSNPASGSVLVEGPDSITLSWSEEITTEASQIRVIDSFGVAQSSELELSVIEDRTTAVLTLSERLPAGNWSITWKIVSADGHLVSGLIPFTVGVLDGGDMTAYSVDDSSIITSSNSRLDRGVEAVTWIGLLISAGLLLGGSYYFSLLMSLITIILVSSRILAFEQEMGSFFTQIGEARAAIFVGLSAFIIFLGSLIKKKVSSFIIFGLIIFSLQGLFSGHHLDLLKDWLVLIASTAHFLHIFAAALWFTAVMALSVNRTLSSVLRTRWLATKALFLLAVAGPLLALTLIIPAWGSSGVDWLVILGIKTLLVLFAAVVGFVHHRKSSKSSEEISADLIDPRAWRNSLGLQIVIFISVLLVSAALTTVNPPVIDKRSSASYTNDIDNIVSTEVNSAITNIQFSGGYSAEIVYPVDLNSSEWVLTFNELPATLPEGIILEAMNPEAGLSGIIIELSKTMNNNYIADTKLPLAGIWHIHADFYIDQFTKEHGMIKLEIK
jgi:methionine-rich copper-binding protein CopC/putative copper export protein